MSDATHLRTYRKYLTQKLTLTNKMKAQRDEQPHSLIHARVYYYYGGP